MAEWLRRCPAKALLFERVGSNPTGVVFLYLINFNLSKFYFYNKTFKFKKIRYTYYNNVISHISISIFLENYMIIMESYKKSEDC